MSPSDERPDARSSGQQRYHHGDLRTALVQAAEQELVEQGIGGLTLRACARRAGVSHAAPKHHFPTLAHLLTALAGQGFERLARRIDDACTGQAQGSLDHLVAACAGYVGFARDNPALFRLMFRQDLFVEGDMVAEEAAADAFSLSVKAVAARTGESDPMGSEAGRRRVGAVWALAHGVADLEINGQFCALVGDAPEDWLRAQLRFMLAALFPER